MIPTLRSIDHFAYTVPDLDEAVELFTTVFGARPLYRQGPVQDTEGDFMARQLAVHPRAACHVSMLRLGPDANLELFAYTAPGQRRVVPDPRSPGGHELAFAVRDVREAVAWLDGRLEVGRVDARSCSLRTAWGMRLRLVRTTADSTQAGGLPGLAGVARASYTVADLDAAVAFLTGPVGGELVERLTDAAVVRIGPTPPVELRSYPGVPGDRPRNSDVGGHHLAFAVDDVVAASNHLAAVPGVRLLGTPQVIQEGGPIDGVHWQYFTGPDGFQFELAFAPPGLPFERGATAQRFRATPERI